MAFYSPYQPYQMGQPMQYTPYQSLSASSMQTGGQIVRVNGYPGAQAYQMGANAAAALFDANDDYFYVKSTDGAGFATIRKFRFYPCDDQEQPQGGEYVTRKEFDELKGVVMGGKQHLREPEAAE